MDSELQGVQNIQWRVGAWDYCWRKGKGVDERQDVLDLGSNDDSI